MPILVFRCPSCQKEVEFIALHRVIGHVISPPHCKECERDMERAPTAAAVQFKEGGVGWAKDGYSK